MRRIIRRSDQARHERLNQRLLHASEKGVIKEAKDLLEEGAQLGSFGKQGSPLHLACIRGHAPMVTLLLEAGAPVNILADTNYAPIHLAVHHHHAGIAGDLIKNNANVNIPTKFEKRTPIHIAAKAHHTDILEILLKNGAHVESSDIYGNTAIHIAARLGNKSAAMLLVKYGARVNNYDNEGWTAMHFAAEAGHADFVHFLTKNHAQLDCQNKYGRTPLHWACVSNHVATVEMMLSLGADTRIKDNSGHTPLNVTTNTVLKQILKFYDSNLSKDDGVSGVTSLDLTLSLKPLLRATLTLDDSSRMSKRSSSNTKSSEEDSQASSSTTDLTNSLVKVFGFDILEFIDECFEGASNVGRQERQTACQHYKHLLMAVGSLLLVSARQIDTLFKNVSSALNQRSQSQMVEVLRTIFERLQSLEDKFRDFQREISAEIRVVLRAIQDIIRKQTLDRDLLERKLDEYYNAGRIRVCAVGIAKHPGLWKKLMVKLHADLTDDVLDGVIKRIEGRWFDEVDRAADMLYFFYFSRLQAGDARFDHEHLVDVLNEFNIGGLCETLRENIQKAGAEWIHCIDPKIDITNVDSSGC